MSATSIATASQVRGGTAAHTTRTQEEIVTSRGARIALAVGRIFIGWTFLWPFLDKTFGLGFSTPAERAWINGGSPAQGYLGGVEGPFAGFLQLFANPFGDWLFMIGLFGIGIAMITGAGVRLAAVTGTILMAMMYLAAIPMIAGGTNPIIDSHCLEAALLIIAAVTLRGDTWGVGRLWGRIIGRHTWLR